MGYYYINITTKTKFLLDKSEQMTYHKNRKGHAGRRSAPTLVERITVVIAVRGGYFFLYARYAKRVKSIVDHRTDISGIDRSVQKAGDFRCDFFLQKGLTFSVGFGIIGVDVDNLWISQPDNGEQALEIAEQLIRSSAIDIIVIDSVAALTPKAEIEGDMGDNKVGLQARLMSQALRKLTGTVSKTRTTCIFINQLREKIGVMFGNPETTTGGNALKFYASVRIDIRGSQPIKDGEEVLGKLTKVKVVKNKVAPPFRKAEFDIMFGEGISHSGEIIDLGAELGIIKKSGSWYSYNDTKLGQGRDAAKVCIKDNPELAEELEGLIFEALNKK